MSRARAELDRMFSRHPSGVCFGELSTAIREGYAMTTTATREWVTDSHMTTVKRYGKMLHTPVHLTARSTKVAGEFAAPSVAVCAKQRVLMAFVAALSIETAKLKHHCAVELNEVGVMPCHQCLLAQRLAQQLAVDRYHGVA